MIKEAKGKEVKDHMASEKKELCGLHFYCDSCNGTPLSTALAEC